MRRTKEILTESIDTKLSLIKNVDMIDTIDTVSNVIADVFNQGGRVYWCGNGGSAADAQHLAAELSGRFMMERDGLPSEALHCNSSYMTAVANDYGYDKTYSRLIKGFGKSGDVLIGISTSGKSANILNAFLEANKKGMITIGMTGSDGGEFNHLCKHLIKVPSNSTARIQECHITIGHAICEQVENLLFNGKD